MRPIAVYGVGAERYVVVLAKGVKVAYVAFERSGEGAFRPVEAGNATVKLLGTYYWEGDLDYETKTVLSIAV